MSATESRQPTLDLQKLHEPDKTKNAPETPTPLQCPPCLPTKTLRQRSQRQKPERYWVVGPVDAHQRIFGPQALDDSEPTRPTFHVKHRHEQLQIEKERRLRREAPP